MELKGEFFSKHTRDMTKLMTDSDSGQKNKAFQESFLKSKKKSFVSTPPLKLNLFLFCNKNINTENDL